MVIYLPASSRYPPGPLPYREGTVAFEKKSFPGKVFFQTGAYREDAVRRPAVVVKNLPSSSRPPHGKLVNFRLEAGRRTGGEREGLMTRA